MSNDGGGSPGQARELERRFDGAMMEIYERAGLELGYWATRYLQMLRRHGGLETARRLLNAKLTSDGYAHLREAGRLDLTVEAYALRAEFQPLFAADELASARDRLGYFEKLGEPPLGKGIPIDPELVRILDEAAAAAPPERIRFRDQVAAFGEPAIPALEGVDGRRRFGRLRMCRPRSHRPERHAGPGNPSSRTHSGAASGVGGNCRRCHCEGGGSASRWLVALRQSAAADCQDDRNMVWPRPTDVGVEARS